MTGTTVGQEIRRIRFEEACGDGEDGKAAFDSVRAKGGGKRSARP